MNVFVHELRSRLRSTLIWMGSIIIFMIVCLAKYDAIAGAGGAAAQALFQKFPASIQAMLGMSGLDPTTVAGYVGMCFLYLVIIVALHAGLVGGGLLSTEAETHTGEFLYAKPRSRTAVFWAKVAAGLVMVVAIWAAATGGSIVAIEKFAHMDGFWHEFWLLMSGLFVVQCASFAVGIASASFARRTPAHARYVALFVVTSYLLAVIAKLGSALHPVGFLSLFAYVDAATIISTTSLQTAGLIGIGALTLILIGVSALRFRTKDLLR